MQIKVITDLVIEPVSLDDIKNYIRLDESVAAEDLLITDFITTARQLCEKITNRSFGQKTIEVYFDKGEVKTSFGDISNFNNNQLTLPCSPHAAVNSVTAIDIQGNETTLVAGTDYRVKGNTVYDVKIMTGIYGDVWTLGNVFEGFRIQFVAGYAISTAPAGGNTTENLPMQGKTAIYKLVKQWYDNRGSIGEVPKEVRNLLSGITLKIPF